MVYQKEMMRKEINEQCAKYDNECLGSHKGTPKEIKEMLNSVRR